MKGGGGQLESGSILKTSTMSTLDRCRSIKLHPRNLGITRVVLFGLVLSALATVTWLRMDIRPQVWLDVLNRGVRAGGHTVGVDNVVLPKVNRLQEENPLQRTNPNTNISVPEDDHLIIDHSNLPSSSSPPPSSFNDDVMNVDASCLSRSQQYQYRKKGYHFPLSGALTKALVEYTRMHSRCSDWDVDHGKGLGAKGCQYVMYYEGTEGLGNRLLSLVAAFTYALVTNRALVIDASRGHLAQLLCEPFSSYSCQNMGTSNCDNVTSLTWVLPSIVARSVQQQAVRLEDAKRDEFVNVTAVHLSLRHEQTVGDRQFFCSETQQGLQKVPWVIWESNQYYVPRLFMLREFWATKLSLWFPDVSRVFTQLGRVLCAPRNDVWDTIMHVHEGEMVWGRARVGIQVRQHGVSGAAFSESVFQRIVECVVNGGVVPPPTTTTTTTKVAVLVTSLQGKYCDKMRERWNETVNGNSTTNGTSSTTRQDQHVKFVMVSHEGSEQYSLDQARKAMVEIWLLSLCNDALATSSWSTFGYVAQALAGMHPRILNIRGAHPELEQPALPACSRGQSPEPCLHYPFTTMDATSSSSVASSCQMLTTTSPAPSRNATDVTMVQLQQEQQEHARWVAQHIRACQDETRGLQLVACAFLPSLQKPHQVTFRSPPYAVLRLLRSCDQITNRALFVKLVGKLAGISLEDSNGGCHWCPFW